MNENEQPRKTIHVERSADDVMHRYREQLSDQFRRARGEQPRQQ